MSIITNYITAEEGGGDLGSLLIPVALSSNSVIINPTVYLHTTTNTYFSLFTVTVDGIYLVTVSCYTFQSNDTNLSTFSLGVVTNVNPQIPPLLGVNTVNANQSNAYNTLTTTMTGIITILQGATVSLVAIPILIQDNNIQFGNINANWVYLGPLPN